MEPVAIGYSVSFHCKQRPPITGPRLTGGRSEPGVGYRLRFRVSTFTASNELDEVDRAGGVRHDCPVVLTSDNHT